MRAVFLALVVSVAGFGCDGGGSDDRALLELRPVMATNPPPCPADSGGGEEPVLPVSSDGKVTECLRLARPIVDARDVRTATVAKTPSGAPALSVVLGGAGGADLDGFAQRNRGERLAIVVDGEVVSAPVVNFTSFAGRVQVTGLSEERTQNLFRRLNDVIKAGD